ncbi:MarR family transcriptional regulator [Microbulbifer salipaludis]|uniref:MarR family transcriptional regulator n=1 Tax=Microbulbifer salipaludis TaxID=187980 RepID=A0ABS3E8P0_9GAMM|nr:MULTISPECIES: helix-turn-helix domain-containing protein [Microbulbifer]MBN8431563.1 MarR family transcriptional regulator [Microbulbifer salipaludis]MCK7596808.1 winged helix-turn-helix domain-containing protein [Microbulbifer sp. CAU 1566]
MLVKLLELTDNNDHPFGNILGREVFKRLQCVVDMNPLSKSFEISLEGIVATDSSFPRESVIALSKQLRGEKWFYITHVSSLDLIDNWDYAAIAKQQSLVLISDKETRVIGPDAKTSTRELLNFVLSQEGASTANVAKALGISVQNASTRLKNLTNQGLIMRREVSSPTGGIEFLYAGPQFSG